MRSKRSRKVLTGWRDFSAGSVNFNAVVARMMRLLMEAVMVIAIVSGMVFVSKMGASESEDKQPKETKKREDDKDINDDDWPYR
jgi:hypothetical protein